LGKAVCLIVIKENNMVIVNRSCRLWPLIKKVFLIFLIFYFSLSCSNTIEPIPQENTAGFCLTFDDTYIKEWDDISDILDSNNVHVTFFLTRIFSVNDNGIKTLHKLENKGHEIGCHGWQHINAEEYLRTNKVENYFNIEVKPSLKYLAKFNFSPTAYSYPYGSNNDSLDNYLLNHFKVLRDVTDEQRKPLEKNIEDIDEIFFDFNKQKVISALGIDANFKITLDMLEKGFERASKNNEIIVLYAHKPTEKITHSYQIDHSYLRQLFNLAEKYKLMNYTFSQLTELKK